MHFFFFGKAVPWHFPAKAVGQHQAHTRPRGGDLTSKGKDMLANQKPEKKQKRNTWSLNWLTTEYYRRRLNSWNATTCDLRPFVLIVVGEQMYSYPDTCILFWVWLSFVCWYCWRKGHMKKCHTHNMTSNKKDKAKKNPDFFCIDKLWSRAWWGSSSWKWFVKILKL